MKPAAPSIFHTQALKCHRKGREQSVLPRLVHPRTFILLWVLLALLAIAGWAVWCALPGLA